MLVSTWGLLTVPVWPFIYIYLHLSFFRYIPRSGMSGSFSNSIYDFLRNFQITSLTFTLSQWPPSPPLLQTHTLYFSHNETLLLCQKLQILSPLGFSIYHFLSLDTFISFSWNTPQLPLKPHKKKMSSLIHWLKLGALLYTLITSCILPW